MRIENLSPNNKSIGIKNLNVEFTVPGIYLVTGQTGVGKTSILKQIIFNPKKTDVFFDNEQESQIFWSERYKLVSFVPQENISYEQLIKDYLKLDQIANKSKLAMYMMLFGLDDQLLNTNLKNLSGGERRKFAIIRSLLKETKYLILDEPTNDLDNNSVQRLSEILKSIEAEHIIIIISHDKRIDGITDNKITFDESSICTSYGTSRKVSKDQSFPNKNDSNVKANNNSIKNNFHVMSFTNMIKFAMMFLIILCWFFIGDTILKKNVNLEDMPKPNNLFVYTADNVYGDLNKRYIEEKHLPTPIKTTNKINYPDIEALSNNNDIKYIFYPDARYIDNLVNAQTNPTTTDDTCYFSFPNYLTTGPELIVYPFDTRGVVAGRLPEDFAMEVALSKEIYNELSNSNRKMKLGDKIKIGGMQYSIVGEANGPVVFLSMSSDDTKNYGYHVYSEATFTKVSTESIKFQRALQYENYAQLDHFLIQTKGGEGRLLNSLIEQYPASNYYSFTFAKAFQKNTNRPIYLWGTLASVLIGLLLSLMLYVLEREALQNTFEIIRDQSYYFINMKKGINAYLRMDMLLMSTSSLLAIIFVTFISTLTLLSLWFVVVVVIANLLASCLIKKRVYGVAG